jgi:hypothetical protein
VLRKNVTLRSPTFMNGSVTTVIHVARQQCVKDVQGLLYSFHVLLASDVEESSCFVYIRFGARFALNLVDASVLTRVHFSGRITFLHKCFGF